MGFFFLYSLAFKFPFIYIYSGKKFGAQPLRGCTTRGTNATLFESPPGKPLIVASIAGVMTPAKKQKFKLHASLNFSVSFEVAPQAPPFFESYNFLC
jgi:hypothetical protein